MDPVFFREELKKAFDQGYSFALFELKAKGIIDEHYNNDSKSSEDCGSKADVTPVNL